MSLDTKPATVFVSYAHESEPFRERVRALCYWLRDQGIALVCDIDHGTRPPSMGWPAWMQHGIEDAAVVLVVASPKYKARFEKRAATNSGKGVAWEGAIITQDLYDAAMRNDKFYPILPDGGARDDIPKAMIPWDNGHWFPSKQEGVLALVRECLRGRAAPAAARGNVEAMAPAPVAAIATRHMAVLDKLTDDIAGALDHPQAKVLRDALENDLRREERVQLAAPVAATELLAALDGLKPWKRQAYSLQRIVKALEIPHQKSGPHLLETLAGDLYFRAAVAAVNVGVAKNFGPTNEAVMVVPQASDAIIALLLAAVAGEERTISPGEQSQHRVDGLIHLDDVPSLPLDAAASFENEAAVRFRGRNVVRHEGDFTPARPDGSDIDGLEKWRRSFADAVENQRAVHKKYFRFVATQGRHPLLDDDASCGALYQTIGIPFARVLPSELTLAQQEELFGIPFTSINRLYGEFFGHLADKRRPMPQAEAPTVAGLIALLTALAPLLTSNDGLKDQIEAAAEQLRKSPDKPDAGALTQVVKGVEQVGQLADGAAKYGTFLAKIPEYVHALQNLF